MARRKRRNRFLSGGVGSGYSARLRGRARKRGWIM